MCLGKNYMMPFFCKWPSPGLNKQSVEKFFFDWHSYLTQLHNVKWLTFIITILLKFYSPPFAKPQINWCRFCMWSLSECNTKLWMLQLRIRKRTVFWPFGFDFSQLSYKLCVVLSVFYIFSCKRFSNIAKKYVWALNVLTGKLNFMME